MTAPPVVTVVITICNIARDVLEEAIESVLTQTYRSREVIIVDDGSSLDMSWVTCLYGDRVRYVRKPNGGPASARNLGIRLAQGDYVAFLDGDDVWVSDKLEAQMAVFARSPETGLLYARAGTIDGEGGPSWRESNRLPKYTGRVFLQLFMRNFIGTSNVVVRKTCFDRVGLFDEARELVEDYDMWLRIAEHYPVDYVDRVLVQYRLHGQGISRNTAYAYAGERLVVERALARSRSQHPELAALMPRRLARIHFACGHEYFTANKLREARAEFAQSLRHQPLRAQTWGYGAATFLGPSAIAAARRIKRWARDAHAPVRVLHVLNTLDMGGAELVALSLARHLDPAAVAVQVCSLSGEGRLADEFRALGVPVHALRRRPGIDLGLPLALARLIRAERIDVVHTHNAGPWLYGGLAAKLSGVRLVHTEHSNLFPHQRRMQRVERWLARWTDVIIADSEKVKRHLIEGQGIPAAKIQTVLNGIDARRFGHGSDPAAARQALGLNGARPIIGTVGRLVPVKDHPTLLAAFQRVAAAHPESRLVIVGDGPMRAELEQEAAARGIRERVLFLGERRDVDRLLRAFDLFVLSSVSEGMPLTILEAMAAGVPVVATRVGGIPEAVADRETGWLVAPGNPGEMAEAMLTLLADPVQCAALGRQAQQRALTQFDVQQMADAYARAYRL